MPCQDDIDRKLVFIRIMLIFVLFLLILPAAVHSETITLVADDWCPYNCEPDSDSPGYIVEVAREIFIKAGYGFEYKNISWARALEEVRKGTYHGAIATAPKEMPDGVFSEEELGFYSNIFIVRKSDSWRFKNIDSLRQVKLGVIKNYDYGKALNAYIQKYKNTMSVQVLSGSNAVEQNLKKLLHNKIDVYLEDRYVAFYTAKKLGMLNKVTAGGREDRPRIMYIGFSPANSESITYARLISEGIKKMRKNGQLAEILYKYGVSDWK